MVLIKDILLDIDITVDSSFTIKESIDKMKKVGYGFIVIVEDNMPKGILTERDLLNIVYKEVDLFDSILTIAKKEIIGIFEAQSVEFALSKLVDYKIRRLVVIDEVGTYKGVLTQEHILKYLENDTFKVDLKVSQIINNHKEIITISQNANISDAVSIMNENSIGSIIITDNEKKPLGIFTEKDLINVISSSISFLTPISKVMSKPVFTANLDDIVKNIFDMMTHNNFRRVLVVDEFGKSLSILTTRDILKSLKANYKDFLESKLISLKSTLDRINDNVIELFDDGNEQRVNWMNQIAIDSFGTSTMNKKIEDIINKDIWEEFYKNIKKDDKIKTKVKINDKSYELLCSSNINSLKNSLFLVLKDVTEYEKAVILERDKRAVIEKELSLIKDIIDQDHSLVIITNGKDVLCVNKTFLEFFNVVDLEQFYLKHNSIHEVFITHESFFSTDFDKNWVEEILRLEEKDRIVSIVDVNRIEPKAFNVHVKPLTSYEGYYSVVLADITNIKIESQVNYFRAIHDNMTRLYNRAFFVETIEFEIASSQRYNNDLSLILLDIDHFKYFNDTFGHLKGDEVLKIVAKTSLLNIRKSDIIARWGGEEFIILLPNTNIKVAMLVADNLRKMIEVIEIPELSKVTASFGVSSFRHNDTRESFIKRADEALYRAKRNGRNRVCSK